MGRLDPRRSLPAATRREHVEEKAATKGKAETKEIPALPRSQINCLQTKKSATKGEARKPDDDCHIMLMTNWF